MKTIIDNLKIDLINQEKATVLIPNHIQLNDLFYEIEFDPKFTGAALFIDVLDGKEKIYFFNFRQYRYNTCTTKSIELF